MKRRAHICICFVTGIALGASAGALASDAPSMPYREIADRNSFGLKALQEKPEPAPVVLTLPKIRLTGITTILGRKIAFLVITGSEPSGLPECLVLAEGQRQDEIQVTEIDEKGGFVKVVNRDQEQTLEFVHADDKIPNPAHACVDRPPNSSRSSDSLSPEEQTILIEAQRLKALQDGDPIAEILPPTDFTPEIMADQ